MTKASLERPAATLRSADRSRSGLAVSLPSLSCPDPALADTLAPDPLSLCYGHHLGVAPAVTEYILVYSSMLLYYDVHNHNSLRIKCLLPSVVDWHR